jgi:hypothetical protein
MSSSASCGAAVVSPAERLEVLCEELAELTGTAEAFMHLGPLLSDAGRSTRLINRRLRRALEHRHPTARVPGCGATRGLHAHHLRRVRRAAHVFRSEVSDLRCSAVTAAG